MQVIPAVDMQDGECVQLVQGEQGTGSTYGDPVEAARVWADAGAELLHLVDLDGAFEGERRNAPHVEAIVEQVDVDVQVGGGIRTAADAEDLFDRGVSRVVVGTAAVEDPAFVEEIAPHGDVMVSLDAREGEVVVEGWTEGSGATPLELAREMADRGAESILFTNVDDEGLLEGVSAEPVRELVEAVDVPIVASGGVSSLDDVRALRDAGAAGVVIGTAFYEGRLNLQDAMEAAR